uniref:ShKT domain-containing protein n=1 Tax=Angiostrongylus cantonensis TaxID=6313 RepID=A0A0K0DKW7_ANGCA
LRESYQLEIFSSSTISRTPYQWNCDNEIDDKGKLCKGWAEGGLCTMHKATMFLFCRKTCLCVGPSV